MVYAILTNEEMTTESQRYNRFIRNGGNAIPKYAGPKVKGSNPITGLTLLWARNPFRGNFNQWQVSRREAGQIFYIVVCILTEMETFRFGDRLICVQYSYICGFSAPSKEVTDRMVR